MLKILNKKENLINLILNVVIILSLADTYFFSKNYWLTIFLIFMIIITGILSLFRMKKYTISKWCYIIVFAEFIVLFFSVLNSRTNFYYQKMWISSVLLTIWFDQESKHDFKNLIKATNIACYILLYIDLITLLPGKYVGADHILSLAGHKNYHTYLLLFTLGFNFIYANINNKKTFNLFNIFTIIFFVYTMRIYDSASMIIGIILFLALTIILPRFFKKKSFFNEFLIFYLIVEYIIIFAENTEFLRNILEEFNRDVTFSGRTTMWYNALDLFLSNIFVGHGYLAEVETLYNENLYNNCHNYILNLLISGGIFYFILYVKVYLHISKNLTNKNVNNWKSIYEALLITLLVLGFSETIIIANSLLLPFLLIGCNMDKNYEVISSE